MCKARRALKNECRSGCHSSTRCLPINIECEIYVEVSYDRLTLYTHVRRRVEVSLLDILQVLHQGLLRSTTSAGMLLECAGIYHDGKGKSRNHFCFLHNLESGLVAG